MEKRMGRKPLTPMPEIGQMFGRWTVMNFDESRKGYYLCKCSCGKEKSVYSSDLKSGKSKSCSCIRGEMVAKRNKEDSTIHGYFGTPTYNSWSGIYQRCMNPKAESYKHYGGRGITICERWRDFQNFLEDMGDKPEGLTLGRIDNDGNYEPSNCRWETHKQQACNRSNNRFITYNGETKILQHWAEFAGIRLDTLRNRIDRMGWSLEKALTTPLDTTRKRKK